jgi:hypothetical protein
LVAPQISSNSLLSVVAVAAIVRIAADVDPAIVGHPLDTRVVTVPVTAVVRPGGGGDASPVHAIKKPVA